MLKTVSKTLGLACVVCAAQTSAAATYDFSFGPASGTRVIGSFDGTTAGDFVVGISNIQASFGALTLAGPLYAYQYNGSSWASPNAVVSFTRANSEFIFVNCPHFACAGDTPGSAYNFFFLRNSSSPTGGFYANAGFVYSENGASTWTLTERVAAVPEPGTWALLAVGLAAVGFMKRSNGRRT